MKVFPLLALLGLTAPGASFTQEPQKGVIEVNVRDSVAGQPVAGAEITFIFFQTPPPNVVIRTTADDTGHTVFPDLAFGAYSVRAQRDGYIDDPAALLGTRVTIGPQSPN